MTAHTTIQQALFHVGDPTSLLAKIADEACGLINAADGASVLTLSDGQLQTVATSEGQPSPQPGATAIAIEDEFTHRLLYGRTPIYLQDIHDDDRVPAECRGGRSRSAILAPLCDRSKPIGMLAVVSRYAGAFDAEDLCSVARICAFAGVVVAASLQTAAAAREVVESLSTPMIMPDSYGRSAAHRGDGQRVSEFLADVIWPGAVAAQRTRQRVHDALLDDELTCVVQPIVNLTDGTFAGAEALSRFSGRPRRGPDIWFAEAHAVGLGIELETLAVRRALAILDQWPRLPRLAINVSPDMLIDGDLPRLLAGHDTTRITIELTEQLAITDYTPARAVLCDLRAEGVRVAIDDVGAGYASFRHVVELEPECIKLDRAFITAADRRPMCNHVARAIVQIARDTGAAVVAEGIETQTHLALARKLGVTLGQGYLFAAPSTPDQIPTRFPDALSTTHHTQAA